MSFDDFIRLLTVDDLEKINEAFRKRKNIKPVYNFSQVKMKDLASLFDVKLIFDHNVFNEWFDYSYSFKDEELIFLQNLLDQEKELLRFYNEEDLKIHFISPILNKVNFKSLKHEVRDFYEGFLSYETDQFILKGVTDFFVAKGLRTPKQPYFFIQEFKKEIGYKNPEPQLLAELISSIEINGFMSIKGAFIIGENWYFVILQKEAQNTYHYFLSRTFNASNIKALRAIYKNLLFVKKEIYEVLGKS